MKDQALLSRIRSSSKEQLSALATKFVTDIRAGQHRQQGWPDTMYGKLATWLCRLQ